MKKYFLITLCAVLLFVVTGCGGNKNQVVCTRSETEDGKTITMDVIIDFDENDKVVDASSVFDFGDKETADMICGLYKQSDDEDKVSCSGTKVTIKGLDELDDEEEDSEQLGGKTKEEVIKAAEEDGFTCK